MKKLTALVLALLMVLSIGAITAMAETYPLGIYEIFVDDPRPEEQFVNVRAGLKRGDSYEIILGQLWNGDRVEVTEVVNTDWGIIEYDGQKGYIRLTYAKFISAVESEDPSEPESTEPESSEIPSEPESSEPESSKDDMLDIPSSLMFHTYKYEGWYVYVPLGDTAGDVLDDLLFTPDGYKDVKNTNGEQVAEDTVVCTGYTANLIVQGDSSAYIVVRGDVDGDGELSSTDYLQIKSYFLNLLTLDGAYFEAADVDPSGTVDATDYLKLKSHFLGLIDIYA